LGHSIVESQYYPYKSQTR